LVEGELWVLSKVRLETEAVVTNSIAVDEIVIEIVTYESNLSSASGGTWVRIVGYLR